MKLLSDNNKIAKGEKFGFYTLGVHLSPHDKSGFNVCQWASEGCAMACNYHLTFSRSESNQAHCEIIAKLGGNVACVFRNELPSTWQGKRVINGDESDLRFRDPKGCIVGLVEKGRAKKDETGFVLN